MSDETKRKLITEYGELLAQKFLRFERAAFYGDVKPIDKMKNMRRELDLQYKKIEVALEEVDEA